MIVRSKISTGDYWTDEAIADLVGQKMPVTFNRNDQSYAGEIIAAHRDADDPHMIEIELETDAPIPQGSFGPYSIGSNGG